MNRRRVIDPRLAHGQRRRKAMQLTAEIPRDVRRQAIELEAEAQRGPIARTAAVDHTSNSALGIEPYANPGQPKCHDHRLTGERRHVADDEHAHRRQINPAAPDEPEIERSDDLAFEPDGPPQRPPLVCMN